MSLTINLNLLYHIDDLLHEMRVYYGNRCKTNEISLRRF